MVCDVSHDRFHVYKNTCGKSCPGNVVTAVVLTAGRKRLHKVAMGTYLYAKITDRTALHACYPLFTKWKHFAVET